MLLNFNFNLQVTKTGYKLQHITNVAQLPNTKVTQLVISKC